MTDQFAHDAARGDLLILVDGLDMPLGSATKERVHREGLLHRAFSVVLVRQTDDGPQLLLSQRAQGKYHSAGLWANSCCSHPRHGEETLDAAYRRTVEELGAEAADLTEIDAFVYRAAFESGLCEYEYDHVLVGICVGEPRPNPSEVSALRWVSPAELARELAAHPEHFAAWSFTVLSLTLAHLQQN